MSHTLVTKADGTQERFDPAKFEHSLERAGASSRARARALSHLSREFPSVVRTSDIYRHAYDILKQEEAPPVAARYSIKRAVFELGPSGFPFEQFLAEVLRSLGWSARADIILQGRCAPHEVDVLAEKQGRRIGIEAKFHNDPGGKTDIQTALYVKARYDDLKQAPLHSSRVDEGWLVTNTRFTENAIRYARCSNLALIGWDYPHGRGLFSMIEEGKVHPITCLTTLSEGQKHRLLENKIVLCRSVTAPHLLQEYGVRPDHLPAVLHEARLLCGA